MGDGGPTGIDQRAVVDPSFSTLVRFGLRPADDPAITNSLEVVDENLRVDTPNGPFWRRFSHDGYGETRTGGEWEITDPGTGTTLGRGWPILTGERGDWACWRARTRRRTWPRWRPRPTKAGLISEQVWDGRPPTGESCCPAGEGGRRHPLTWSHGNLIRLAWTIQRGEPVDRREPVAGRYQH